MRRNDTSKINNHKNEETLPKLEELEKGDPKEETLPKTGGAGAERSKIKRKRVQKIEDEILRCIKEIIADDKSAPKYQQNDCT